MHIKSIKYNILNSPYRCYTSSVDHGVLYVEYALHILKYGIPTYIPYPFI